MTAPSKLPSSVRVPFGTLWRYGIGQIGGQLFRDAPATLLPIFMTTMLGIEPWIAGIAIIVPKLWLIVCDPLVGALSDRFKVRFGRTPFLAVGAVATGIGFAIIFSMPALENPVLTACGVSFIFLVASTGFSAFSVPYLALAAEVSNDAHERSRMLSARLMGAMLGGIAGIGLAQPTIAFLGGGAHAWSVTALLLGALCLATMLVTALTMHRRAEREGAPEQQEGLFTHIVQALRQREFGWLTLTFLLISTAQGCGFTVVSFVFLYNVGNVNLILPYVLISSATVAISYPIWLVISRRWDNATCFLVSNVGYTLLCISTFWITPGNDVLLNVPVVGSISTQQMVVLVRGAPQAFFASGYLLFVFSTFTDTVNRIRQRSGGAVNEGVFSGIFSATEKLSFAVAPLIAGIVLSASGFATSFNGPRAQSAGALTGILSLYSLIPSAMHIVSLGTFWAYLRTLRRDGAMQPALAG